MPGENHSVVSAYTAPYKQKFSFGHSFFLLFVCFFLKKIPNAIGLGKSNWLVH